MTSHLRHIMQGVCLGAVLLCLFVLGLLGYAIAAGVAVEALGSFGAVVFWLLLTCFTGGYSLAAYIATLRR